MAASRCSQYGQALALTTGLPHDADETAIRLERVGLPSRDVICGPTGLWQIFVGDTGGNREIKEEQTWTSAR